MGKFTSRGGERAGGNGLPWQGDLDPWFKEFEALCEYLTEDKWEDGKARQTATLTLSVDDGRLKACLNDRANQRSAWFSGATLQGLFCCVEEALRNGEVDWRRNSWGKGRK